MTESMDFPKGLRMPSGDAELAAVWDYIDHMLMRPEIYGQTTLLELHQSIDTFLAGWRGEGQS